VGPWPRLSRNGIALDCRKLLLSNASCVLPASFLGKLVVFCGCSRRAIGDPPELNKLWHAICLVSPGNMCTPTGLCCRPSLWGHTKQLCQVHRLCLRGGPLWTVSSNNFQMDTRHCVRGVPTPSPTSRPSSLVVICSMNPDLKPAQLQISAWSAAGRLVLLFVLKTDCKLIQHDASVRLGTAAT
jgi:hypothetical protein